MSVSLKIWLVFDVMWWKCTKKASFYVCDPKHETARTAEDIISELLDRAKRERRQDDDESVETDEAA